MQQRPSPQTFRCQPLQQHQACKCLSSASQMVLKMEVMRRWRLGVGGRSREGGHGEEGEGVGQEGEECITVKCKRNFQHYRSHLEQWGSAMIVYFLNVPIYRWGEWMCTPTWQWSGLRKWSRLMLIVLVWIKANPRVSYFKINEHDIMFSLIIYPLV